jgi:hypothetical protein
MSLEDFAPEPLSIEELVEDPLASPESSLLGPKATGTPVADELAAANSAIPTSPEPSANSNIPGGNVPCRDMSRPYLPQQVLQISKK